MAVHRLNTMRLAKAFGFFWASAMLLIGLLDLFGGRTSIVSEAIGEFYLGYTPTLPGIIIGMIWGFFDGFIGGYIFGWIYNKI